MDTTAFTQEVQGWFSELEASRKREKEFRKRGREVVEIYEACKREDTPFNILYSNTDTLMPALYNNVPRPVVDRRYKDSDPVGKMASLVTKRSLEFLIDSNDQDYSNFDDMMKSAVLEALLPGRGITRFKYDAEISGEGETAKVESETVCGEEVAWDRTLFGYAKKWKDVPWLAFEHFMTKQELEDNFGEKAVNVPCNIKGGQEEEESDGDGGAGKDDESLEKFAHVYEIWDKLKKKVTFIAVGHGEVLKSVADPLGLSGFYPCPRPMQFTMMVSGGLPAPLYLMYQNQAEELNAVTTRINKLIRALKVRGFYDSTLTGLDKVLEADDNTLIPAENVAAMLQGQTLEKAIWLFPLEKLITVLQQLYVQRQQIKDVIYEITGVSDILRGSSVASETATAQNIKNQWGTLRLKRMQKEVMRYSRDCLRIMAEIAVEKLSSTTIAQMTGLQIPTGEQKQQAQMAAQQLQAQAQAQPPVPGQPPPPPPPQMAQIQKILSMPSWDEIMAVLKNDIQRHYRIDIETNSTVDAEATEDKADVAEFLNAISQFLNGIAPMIEQGYMQFDVAKTMLLAIVRRFRFGTEVEDQITQMQAPPPKGPEDDPKVKADMAKAQMQMKADEAQMAHDQQMMQQEGQLKQAEMNAKMQELAMKQQLSQAQHEAAMEEIAAKRAQTQAQTAAAIEASQAKAAAARQPKGE